MKPKKTARRRATATAKRPATKPVIVSLGAEKEEQYLGPLDEATKKAAASARLKTLKAGGSAKEAEEAAQKAAMAAAKEVQANHKPIVAPERFLDAVTYTAAEKTFQAAANAALLVATKAKKSPKEVVNAYHKAWSDAWSKWREDNPKEASSGCGVIHPKPLEPLEQAIKDRDEARSLLGKIATLFGVRYHPGGANAFFGQMADRLKELINQPFDPWWKTCGSRLDMGTRLSFEQGESALSPALHTGTQRDMPPLTSQPIGG